MVEKNKMMLGWWVSVGQDHEGGEDGGGGDCVMVVVVVVMVLMVASKTSLVRLMLPSRVR